MSKSNPKPIPCVNCITFVLCRSRYLAEFEKSIKRQNTSISKEGIISSAKIIARLELQVICPEVQYSVYDGQTRRSRGLDFQFVKKLEEIFLKNIDVESIWNKRLE